MSEDLKTYQLIQDYLRGSLSPAEAEAVESRAAQDTDFEQLLEEERALSSLVQATIANEVRADVNEAFKAQKQKSNMVKAMIGTAASILVLTGAALLFTDGDEAVAPETTSDSTEVVDQNTSTETAIPTPKPIVRDTIIEHEGVETPVQVITHVNHEGDTTKTVTVAHESKDTIAVEHHEVLINSDTTTDTPVNINITQSDDNPCSGIDPNIEIEIEMEHACLFGGTGFIEVSITDSGDEHFFYSLNGSNKNNEGDFYDLDPGKYELYVSDTYGCREKKKSIELKTKRCQNLPIAFNPDVDEWTYETNGENATLIIMSRFGKEIYSETSDSPSWDGRTSMGDEAKTDDYIFTISMDGQIIDKGNVTLVRQ